MGRKYHVSKHGRDLFLFLLGAWSVLVLQLVL
jgi:hypothetical protein